MRERERDVEAASPSRTLLAGLLLEEETRQTGNARVFVFKALCYLADMVSRLQ